MTQNSSKGYNDVKPVQKAVKTTKLEIIVNTSDIVFNGNALNAKQPTYIQGGEVWIPVSTLKKLFPNCEKDGKIVLEVKNA